MEHSQDRWRPDGRALKAWRAARRPRAWDQQTLAREAGINANAVYRIETGRGVLFATRARLAAFTGLTDALLSPEERALAASALGHRKGTE